MPDAPNTNGSRPSTVSLVPHVGREAFGTHRGLPLHAGQRRALGLGLDDPDGALLDVEEVVGSSVAGLHDRLADGDTLSGEQVQVLAVLDVPAGVGELAVDEHARALLSCQPADHRPQT